MLSLTAGLGQKPVYFETASVSLLKVLNIMYSILYDLLRVHS